MSTFGNIDKFDANVESWTHYTERLEQFFIANGVAEENRQRAIFLTVVGPTTYALLRNLLSPESPSSKSLTEIIDVLNGHFDPVPSEIVERFKFNSRVRQPGESVANFLAELRRLAKFCNYGPSLDEMLRDRIVCGIQDEAMQRKMLGETKLTLVRATEIAVSMEAAARDAIDLQGMRPGDVNKIQTKRNLGNKQKQEKPRYAAMSTTSNANKKCTRCGEGNHYASDCKFRNSTCHNCKKTGHIARVCRSKEKLQTNVNRVEESNEIHTLFSIQGVGIAPPPASVICTVQGRPVSFEVDSGAPFTLMPSLIYEKFKRFFPPLQPSTIKLQSYTQHAIDVMGAVNVDVMYKSRTYNMPLIIVKEGNVSLAGRNWIYPLQLMSVFDSNPQTCNISAPKLTIQTLMDKFKGLFASNLGKVKDIKVHLSKQPNVSPKFFKARQVPYALKEKVDQEISRLIEDGILKPVKTSEWAAPIVPVLKQDGRIRICGDFKLTTNKATELEQYPLPKIEDLFAQLSGGSLFTKLDFRDAYCQLELDEESRNLVVINTQRGLFSYTRLPFGVASAPAIFQREMDKILQGLKGASCYLDDLLVTGRDEAEHLKNLNDVLTRLESVGIKLHPDKCEFMKSSVQYLGHRIDKHGLHPVESKVEAIVNAPDPKNVDELRSFLGLVTYYAKFLPNMATSLAPLYKLLEQKQTWNWGAQEKEAFVMVKDKLQGSSVLMHFDNNKEVILACDASPYGLGAVLSHQTPEGDRPVAFASRSLTKAEKNYSHIEKETLALVFGVTRFRNYLLGRTFTLLTDHRPLVNLLSENKPVPSVAAARIQRWALTLAAYSYRIKFRKGSLHSNADACSRLPVKTKSSDPPAPAESVLLLRQLNDSPVTAFLIASELEKCSVMKQIGTYIRNGWPKQVNESLRPFWQVRQELTIEQNVIFRGSRVFIPMKFRQFVLDDLHSAHQGISAIKALARSYVWWPGIDHDLEMKVKKCTDCQENASSPPATQLSWPIPQEPWERIHIDHAGPIDGHMLLIIIDAKSKWLEVLPVPNTSSSATIVVLRDLFARFGLPRSLVSDNGTGFCSTEFSTFLRKNGITHIRTAPYHPNSNGLAERAVRTVKLALKKVTGATLAEKLARFLCSFRNTPAASTNISPATMIFGHPLRTRLDLLKEVQHTSEVSNKQLVFKPGDPVWVRNFGRGQKWIEGKVVGNVGNIMFKIETAWGIWSRHLDQLRKRSGGSRDLDILTTPAMLPEIDLPESSHLEAGDMTVNSPSTPTKAADDQELSMQPEAKDSEPPKLSPQPEMTISSARNLTPPVLTPQVKISDSVENNLRRSARIKCKQLQA